MENPREKDEDAKEKPKILKLLKSSIRRKKSKRKEGDVEYHTSEEESEDSNPSLERLDQSPKMQHSSSESGDQKEVDSANKSPPGQSRRVRRTLSGDETKFLGIIPPVVSRSHEELKSPTRLSPKFEKKRTTTVPVEVLTEELKKGKMNPSEQSIPTDLESERTIPSNLEFKPPAIRLDPVMAMKLTNSAPVDDTLELSREEREKAERCLSPPVQPSSRRGTLKKTEAFYFGNPFGSTSLYSWGANDIGQLGLGVSYSSNSVVSMISTITGRLQKKKISFITCSYSTSAAVTSEGELFIWGKTGSIIARQDSHFPVEILLKDAKVKEIALGSESAVFVTDYGRVFSWGKGDYGKLGHGDCSSQPFPKLIDTLISETITAVACGDFHSVFLSTEGKLFGCGDSRLGQLGFSHQQDIPIELMGLAEKEVVSVTCGKSHTTLLTSGREVYVYGGKTMSQTLTLLKPRLVQDLSGCGIVKIASGSLYSVALSEVGKVWIWGSEKQFNCEEQPQVISALISTVVTNVWCGEKHLAATSRNDTLYLIGSNEKAQLATNSAEKTMNQVRINERDIWMVACGTHHTIVLAKHFSTTDTELKKLLRIQQNLLRALACLKESYHDRLTRSKTMSQSFGVVNSLGTLVIPTFSGERKKDKMRAAFFMEKDLKGLFRNLDQLIRINSQFYFQLEMAFSHLHALKEIGQLLGEHVATLRNPYIVYFEWRDWDDQMIFQEWSSKPEVQTYLSQLQERAEKEFPRLGKVDVIQHSLISLLKCPLIFLRQFSIVLTPSIGLQNIDEIKAEYSQLILELEAVSKQKRQNNVRFLANEQKTRLESLKEYIQINQDILQENSIIMKEEASIVKLELKMAQNYEKLSETCHKDAQQLVRNYSKTLQEMALQRDQYVKELSDSFHTTTSNSFHKLEGTFVDSSNKMKKFEEELNVFESNTKLKDSGGKKRKGSMFNLEKQLDFKKEDLKELEEDVRDHLDSIHSKKEEHVVNQVWRHYEILKNFFTEGFKKIQQMEEDMNSLKDYAQHMSRSEVLADQFQHKLESMKNELNLEQYESIKNDFNNIVSHLRNKRIDEVNYQTLTSFIKKSIVFVKAIANSSSKTSTLDSLTMILDSEGMLVDLMQQEISQEVALCKDYSTLFRGNSLGTKLMSAIARMAGIKYVRKILQTYIDKIANSPKLYDIDKFQVQDGESHPNVPHIKEICQQIMTSILNSTQQIPLIIRVISQILRQETMKKFPDKLNAAIGGFVFLRFFGPMLMTPQNFHLINVPMTEDISRAFLLISKIIQSIANGIPISRKEPEYASFDELAFSFADPLKEFYITVSNVENGGSLQSPYFENSSEVIVKQLQNIHKFLFQNIDRMVLWCLSNECKELLPDLFHVMKELGPPSSE